VARKVNAGGPPDGFRRPNICAVPRILRKQYEDQVSARISKAEETIAQARFARDGTAKYPDAIFTLRLS
jgi:hypothetical protein